MRARDFPAGVATGQNPPSSIGLLPEPSSAELKRDLVDFACNPRLERPLAAAMLEAGLEEPEEADAINIIDRFALQYRLPDGKTVVDRFVASRPDLDTADREMLLGWREPVEGIFEIRRRDGDAIILLNLLDDRRKAWYYRHEPRPGVSVIGDRLLELASGGRR